MIIFKVGEHLSIASKFENLVKTQGQLIMIRFQKV